jgi:heme O synthase-like polyprenyltransferase
MLKEKIKEMIFRYLTGKIYPHTLFIIGTILIVVSFIGIVMIIYDDGVSVILRIVLQIILYVFGLKAIREINNINVGGKNGKD